MYVIEEWHLAKDEFEMSLDRYIWWCLNLYWVIVGAGNALLPACRPIII